MHHCCFPTVYMARFDEPNQLCPLGTELFLLKLSVYQWLLVTVCMDTFEILTFSQVLMLSSFAFAKILLITEMETMSNFSQILLCIDLNSYNNTVGRGYTQLEKK